MISWTQIGPIDKDEKAFFVQLGAQIASLRKEQGITRVRMAELLGEESAAAVEWRGPAPKLRQQMERIQRLRKAKQRFVMKMIDTVLARQVR